MKNMENVFENLIANNERMVQEALELRNLVLKYSVARNDKTLNRVCEKMNILKKQDIIFMNSLIESILIRRIWRKKLVNYMKFVKKLTIV